MKIKSYIYKYKAKHQTYFFNNLKMSQILSSKNNLTQSQIDACVKNFAAIRHFDKIEKIFEGKPSFSDAAIQQIKSLGLEPVKITKFADNYTIYKLTDVVSKPKAMNVDQVKLIKSYDNDIKIKNLNDRIEFMIVINSDKIDKQNYLALQSLYPLIHNDLCKNKGYSMLNGGENSEKSTPDYIQYYKYNGGDCYVTVCPTNHIETAMQKHFNTRFLPCNYRVISLYDVYPIIGSKSQIWASCLSKYFEVCEYEPLYNGMNYSIIYDDEPLVKILNANIGDIIIGMHFINEIRPYGEFTIKQVTARNNDNDDDEI